MSLNCWRINSTVNQYETIYGNGLIYCWVTNGFIDCFQINSINTSIPSVHRCVLCRNTSHLRGCDGLLTCRLLYMVTDAAMGGSKSPSRTPTPPPIVLGQRRLWAPAAEGHFLEGFCLQLRISLRLINASQFIFGIFGFIYHLNISKPQIVAF